MRGAAAATSFLTSVPGPVTIDWPADQERAIEIMRDSRLATYVAFALTLGFLAVLAEWSTW